MPASRSVTGVTDAGQAVNLDVHVLLDGVPPARARETMAAAATSYAPLKVALRPVRYREVRIAADGTAGGQPTGEIGRLLGADHHHANCVEGPPPQPCTVMLAADYERLGVNSMRFGSVEAAVVRGHAVDSA